MANYQLLKADIDAKVYENGQQEITGANLNSVLNAMVTTLGAEYQFAGVATKDTNPGTPDAKVFYIANGKGTYTNFGGINVTEDDVVVLTWDSSWHKVSTGIASQAKLTELESKVNDISKEAIVEKHSTKTDISSYSQLPLVLKKGLKYHLKIICSGDISSLRIYANSTNSGSTSGDVVIDTLEFVAANTAIEVDYIPQIENAEYLWINGSANYNVDIYVSFSSFTIDTDAIEDKSINATKIEDKSIDWGLLNDSVTNTIKKVTPVVVDVTKSLSGSYATFNPLETGKSYLISIKSTTSFVLSEFKMGTIQSRGSMEDTIVSSDMSIVAGEEYFFNYVPTANVKVLGMWNTANIVSVDVKIYLTANEGFILNAMLSNGSVSYDKLNDDLKSILPNQLSIIGANHDAEQHLKNLYFSTYYNQPQNILSIAHITDIHGDDDCLGRYIQFCNKYASYIDEMIHTGDSANTAFNYQKNGSEEDAVSIWTNETFSPILNIIGNHDTTLYVKDPYTWNTLGYKGKPSYDKYIAPYASMWGIVSVADKCYYYKDYQGKKIRVIALDCMDAAEGHIGEEQAIWFANTLEDARQNGYAVIVLDHFIPYSYTKFECPFNSIKPDAKSNDTRVVSAVSTFIKNGGEFIAYLCGHTHKDYCGVIDYDETKQIFICCASGSDKQSASDMARVQGTKSQDCFNIECFDTTNKIIKVYRIGADEDLTLRKKETLCIDYINSVIVA